MVHTVTGWSDHTQAGTEPERTTAVTEAFSCCSAIVPTLQAGGQGMPAALCQVNMLSRTAHATGPKQHRPSTVTSSSKLQSTVVTAAAAAALLLQASLPPVVYAVNIPEATQHSWQPCPNGQQCVSTNSFMQPAQYLPAWNYEPDSIQTALRWVVSLFQGWVIFSGVKHGCPCCSSHEGCFSTSHSRAA